MNSPIGLPFAGQNPIIRTGRHAISIHERRCCYQDNLWGPPLDGQDIRQVWFLGVHSDVGGSYDERAAGLPKIALEWMLVEAEKAGLLVDPEKAQVLLGRKPAPYPFMPKYVEPDNNACLHNSFQGAWWILEYFPRKMMRNGRTAWTLPRGKWVRQIPVNSVIHASALSGKHALVLPQGCYEEPWVAYRSPTLHGVVMG